MDTENDNEVLTFREAFLGSRALELLVAGCVRPTSTPEFVYAIVYLCACQSTFCHTFKDTAASFPPPRPIHRYSDCSHVCPHIAHCIGNCVEHCHVRSSTPLIGTDHPSSHISPCHIPDTCRYVDYPPESEDEKAALAQLLDACLGGESALHGALAAALCSVSGARAAAGRPVLVADCPLSELVANAVGALKLKVGANSITRLLCACRVCETGCLLS